MLRRGAVGTSVHFWLFHCSDFRRFEQTVADLAYRRQTRQGSSVFTAWRTASAAYATALCPCQSVRHKSEFYRNGWTNRAGFGMGASYTVLQGNSGRPTSENKSMKFAPNSGRTNFATANRSSCQQNSSTVELADHTYDNRRVVAGRTQFITCRSTVTFWLHYFELFSICATTCSYSCAAVNRILTGTRRAGRLRSRSFLFSRRIEAVNWAYSDRRGMRPSKFLFQVSQKVFFWGNWHNLGWLQKRRLALQKYVYMSLDPYLFVAESVEYEYEKTLYTTITTMQVISLLQVLCSFVVYVGGN